MRSAWRFRTSLNPPPTFISSEFLVGVFERHSRALHGGRMAWCCLGLAPTWPFPASSTLLGCSAYFTDDTSFAHNGSRRHGWFPEEARGSFVLSKDADFNSLF